MRGDGSFLTVFRPHPELNLNHTVALPAVRLLD